MCIVFLLISVLSTHGKISYIHILKKLQRDESTNNESRTNLGIESSYYEHTI